MMRAVLKTIAVLLALFVVSAVGAGQEAVTPDTTMLPRSAPEAQGVSSPDVFKFVKTADRKIASLHSFMLVRHGHVVAEAWWKPESADNPHELWSLSKSFTSTAVGLAIDEGKLSLEDRVIKFFPDDLPREVSENLKNMRVRDLLTMSAGHRNEAKVQKQSNWVKAFLAHPVPHKPGTHFQYNTPGTFMLSAIVQKATKQTVLDYLQSRLFDPLGIKRPIWGTNPQGITLGGYGLDLRTEDIAKFGQLYLQKGKWQGNQIVPADWVALATSKQVSNGSTPGSDWSQGYGFQFWRCRHNAYRGDGRDGQFCIVIPKHDAVIAITANTGDMQAVLNLVWGKLLPAFHQRPLTANPSAVEKLHRATSKLKATR